MEKNSQCNNRQELPISGRMIFMSMKMIGTVSTEAKLESFRSRNGSKTSSVRVNQKKKKKKRLQYSFKSISNQILMTKTPDGAKQVLTKARGKVAMLKRHQDNDSYDATELRHAIIHAQKMVRIAKKRVFSCVQDLLVPFLLVWQP